ncbi:TPA: hypothetical protein DD617_01600 [Candidatus Uhrbacteria bacterium]|nr:hypothetical protein [Candidatus Uhrbacteria bacterium]
MSTNSYLDAWEDVSKYEYEKRSTDNVCCREFDLSNHATATDVCITVRRAGIILHVFSEKKRSVFIQTASHHRFECLDDLCRSSFFIQFFLFQSTVEELQE